MKKYSIEIYFDKDGSNEPLDKEPELSNYSAETKLVNLSGEDYEEVRKRAKEAYPSARYLHLIDRYDLDI